MESAVKRIGVLAEEGPRDHTPHAVLALQLERRLSKEEILTAYLNTIYLGYGCYGVDTAAKKYFSKDIEERKEKVD